MTAAQIEMLKEWMTDKFLAQGVTNTDLMHQIDDLSKQIKEVHSDVETVQRRLDQIVDPTFHTQDVVDFLASKKLWLVIGGAITFINIAAQYIR